MNRLSKTKSSKFQVGLSTVFLLMATIGMWVAYMQELERTKMYEEEIPKLEEVKQKYESMIDQLNSR